MCASALNCVEYVTQVKPQLLAAKTMYFAACYASLQAKHRVSNGFELFVVFNAQTEQTADKLKRSPFCTYRCGRMSKQSTKRWSDVLRAKAGSAVWYEAMLEVAHRFPEHGKGVRAACLRVGLRLRASACFLLILLLHIRALLV